MISYLFPSSELLFLPRTQFLPPPFSLTKGKPRPRIAPAPPLQSLVRLPLVFLPTCFMGWPVPPLVLPGADPSWGLSISSTVTSSGNISHSFTSLSPQAFPHQYTICFSSSPIISSPPSFYTLASAPTSPPNLPGSLMTCTVPDSVLLLLYLLCVPQPMAMPSSLKQPPSQLLGTALCRFASYLPDGSFLSPCCLLLCLTSE